ncbi:hypothetical protein [Celeribacter halophilus]|uniref:hypothetical protein n=1 Tax=Celeribacter halophilus TaxID=576117 RepID=UPI003A8E875C
MNEKKLLARFLKSDQGAITVDWVVLTAALIGMGIGFALALSGGIEALADGISTSLSNQHVGIE